MQTNLVFTLALLFRYDPDLARFEDPPSDEVEISENLKHKHCLSCCRLNQIRKVIGLGRKKLYDVIEREIKTCPVYQLVFLKINIF
jgi:hypothetical protein